RVSLGIRYESIGIENTEGRFIEAFFGINDELPRDDFLGADFNYNFTNIDNKAFPTLGLNFDLTVGYRNNVKNTNNFGFIIPSMAIDYKLVPNGQLVLGSKVLGHFNIGDDFEFYQAASIGGNNGLRGYRNERFSGKSAFVQSTDLRLKLNRKKTSVVPIESGIYAAFDYGRVWVDEDLVANSEYNEDGFNTSFGGGVFFNLVDMISAKLGAFNSQDGLRIAFSFGFGL
ncbi:MAG: phosphoesterase, partial [Bacteroidia bacterium]|nr:phosphoesterase [Bacteroidia bacterium]